MQKDRGALKRKRLYYPGILLLLLIMCVTASNYLWLILDKYPAGGHDLLGIIPSAEIYREIMNINVSVGGLKYYDHILGVYHGWLLMYPPLSFLIVALYYLLFGLQGQMVAMVNTLYVIVALACVYCLAKRMYNAWIGLLSAFILSSFPCFISSCRVYWIEFGLLAYVSLGLYLLIKTEFFARRGYAVLLGIILALSFLHKYEALLFMIGPFLLVVYKSRVLHDILKRRWSGKATNLLLSVAVTLLLTYFWWSRYYGLILNRILLVQSAGECATGQGEGVYQRVISSVTYYFSELDFLISRIYLILFVLSISFMIIQLVRRGKRGFFYLYLASSFIIPYAVLSIPCTKSPSHIVPLFSVIALSIVGGIAGIRYLAMKRTLIALLCLYGVYLHSHSFFPMENRYCRLLDGFSLHLKGHASNYDYITFYPPRKEKLEVAIKAILEYIHLYSRGIVHPKIFVLTQEFGFNHSTFEYYRLVEGYRFSCICSPFEEDASECHYLVIEKLKNQSINEAFTEEHSERISEREVNKRFFSNGLEGFELIKIYPIPDSDASVYIYKNTALPLKEG